MNKRRLMAFESLRAGWLEIRANAARSVLTSIAVAIGVAAMVYAFSQISWMWGLISKIERLGGPGRLEISTKDGYVSKGRSKGLTWQDAQEIRLKLPGLYMVRVVMRRWGTTLRFGDFKNDDICVLGITPEWARREWQYKIEGRFINEHDVRNVSRVCVLVKNGVWRKKPWWDSSIGDKPLTKALKHQNFLGKQIYIGGSSIYRHRNHIYAGSR